MAIEWAAGAGLLKGAWDAIMEAQRLSTSTAVNKALIEAQDLIFKAQADRMALHEEVAKLKERLAQFENWELEKEKYELKDLGSGCRAYVSKPTNDPAAVVVTLCANCYEDRRKSLLQGPTTIFPGRRPVMTCPHCKDVLALDGVRQSPA